MNEGLAWLAAFAFTQAVEMPIYRFGAKTRIDEAFCASAITHPVVWFVIPYLYERLYVAMAMRWEWARVDDRIGYWVMVFFCEAFAVGVEAGYLKWLGKKRPLAWSFAANLASVSLGFLSRAVFHFP